jgi:hypothetical protein
VIAYRVESRRNSEGEFKAVNTYPDIEDAIVAARTWRQAARQLAGQSPEVRIVRIGADGSGQVVMPRITRVKGDGR